MSERSRIWAAAESLFEFFLLDHPPQAVFAMEAVHEFATVFAFAFDAESSLAHASTLHPETDVTRDLRLALIAKRNGARYSLRIIREAKKAGIPISWALALCEQESNYQNIFGHDGGSILHGQRVTKDRVQRLLRHIDRGGVSNGVGLTQLTNPTLIRQAEKAGGAHIVRHQLEVGFRFFKQVTGGDYSHKAWRYNGGHEYQARIAERQKRWHARLA